MSQPGQYGQQPDPSFGGAPPPGWSGGPAPAPTAPPQEVNTSFWLWVANVVLGVIGAVVTFTRISGLTEQIVDASGSGGTEGRELASSIVTASIVVGAVFGLVIVALQLLFAVFMRRGRNWARIVLTIFGAIGVITAIIGFAGSGTVTVNGQTVQTSSTLTTILSVLQAIVIIVAIVMFFRPRANAYFTAMGRRV